MLVYMLVLSSLGMFIWATAWGSQYYMLSADFTLSLAPGREGRRADQQLSNTN